MIKESPLWSATNVPSGAWSNHRLIGDRVLGIWQCLDRVSGQEIWTRNIPRANVIRGVDSGIIVASEIRWDSPTVYPRGIYGIRLEDGELAWTSHAPKMGRKILRALDFVPDFANEISDTPVAVREGKCYTRAGRILDVLTGDDIGRIETDALPDDLEVSTQSKLLKDRRLQLGDLGTLVLDSPGDNERGQYQPLKLRMERHGEMSWKFDVASRDSSVDPRFPFYTELLIADHWLYLRLTSSQSAPRTSTGDPQFFYRLWTIDLRTGGIAQDFPLSNEPLSNCTLEDADDRHMLISFARYASRHGWLPMSTRQSQLALHARL